MKRFILIFISILLFIVSCQAQQINTITSQCPAPNQLIKSAVRVTGIGDITYVPCPARSNIFTGLVDFSGATVSGVVTGAGTTNFIPRYTNGAAGVIGNTPFSWNGSIYDFNNTTLNATFKMVLTPSVAGSGLFSVGNLSTAFLSINESSDTLLDSAGAVRIAPVTANEIHIGQTLGADQIFINTGVGIEIGDSALTANRTVFTVSDNSQRFTFANQTEIATIEFTGIQTFQLLRTITAAGTTGDQTIHKPNGTVNFAVGASDIVITNNSVATTSLIQCTVQSLDATAISCRITDKAAGSFHIRVPAATAETSVAFWVWN